jgi:hypothetical protein
MGARITSPNSRRLLFPSSSLTSSSSSSSSTFFSPPFLPYSPAAAVLPWPPVLGVALMTMATTCHWSSFGRPVPNWTHVSVANARLFIIERLITFFLSSSSPSRYFFFWFGSVGSPIGQCHPTNSFSLSVIPRRPVDVSSSTLSLCHNPINPCLRSAPPPFQLIKSKKKIYYRTIFTSEFFSKVDLTND